MAEQLQFSGCGVTIEELEAQAIKCLQMFAPEDGTPYYGGFSGGKDSCVIRELGRRSGVPIEWWYNQTTIDPPQLVKFIKREHPDVQWSRPKMNFFAMMKKRGFPTRRNRWCCLEYKESKTPVGRRMILGIRAAESPRRRTAWKQVTRHNRTGEWAVNPIISWTDKDVWDYIRWREIPYCSLYDEGFKRLGCIGCPMARHAGRLEEFRRWPRYEALWKKSFKSIWERRAGSNQRDGREWFGSARFESWEAMWEWWLSNESLPAEDDECEGLPLT